MKNAGITRRFVVVSTEFTRESLFANDLAIRWNPSFASKRPYVENGQAAVWALVSISCGALPFTGI